MLLHGRMDLTRLQCMLLIQQAQQVELSLGLSQLQTMSQQHLSHLPHLVKLFLAHLALLHQELLHQEVLLSSIKPV